MSGPVGFIGLGIMGTGQARNLLRAGRSLVVWNRSAKKAQELEAGDEAWKGRVETVSSPGEVVKKCDLVYSMLSTLEASSEVFPEIVREVAPGKMIVDCATLTPERMAEMAKEVRAKGGLFLEAPVSGSKGPAEQGKLIFMTAGDEGVRDAAAKDLSVMGKATYYFGPEVGAASKMKIIVNMIMGVQLNALAEGVALTEACGLPVKDLLSIIEQGAMNSMMTQAKGPCMEKREYPPAFPLKHAQKDMRFAVALADEVGLAVPVAAASNEQFKKVRTKHGDEDFSAVAEASRTNKLA